jgi:hypothetical protein
LFRGKWHGCKMKNLIDYFDDECPAANKKEVETVAPTSF